MPRETQRVPWRRRPCALRPACRRIALDPFLGRRRRRVLGDRALSGAASASISRVGPRRARCCAQRPRHRAVRRRRRGGLCCRRDCRRRRRSRRGCRAAFWLLRGAAGNGSARACCTGRWLPTSRFNLSAATSRLGRRCRRPAMNPLALRCAAIGRLSARVSDARKMAIAFVGAGAAHLGRRRAAPFAARACFDRSRRCGDRRVGTPCRLRLRRARQAAAVGCGSLLPLALDVPSACGRRRRHLLGGANCTMLIASTATTAAAASGRALPRRQSTLTAAVGHGSDRRRGALPRVARAARISSSSAAGRRPRVDCRAPSPRRAPRRV